MRLGITGTYSSGKTFTTMALAEYTGLRRTRARTMREILPEAAPGKRLEEISSAQLIQMIVVRHTERCVEESLAGDSFVSDGCSLQEWAYGALRVQVGINPNESAELGAGESVERTPELDYFDQVMQELGNAFKRHVKQGFDLMLHLRNELDLDPDGHRPVNETFRSRADETLRQTFEAVGVPFWEVSGSVEERLVQIQKKLDLPIAVSLDEAIAIARAEYSAQDTRSETQRSRG